MFTTLISTEALAASREAAWAVVDCRYDLKDTAAGRLQYLAGHIPGAVYASLSHDLSGPPDGSNGRHPLPSVDAMRHTFGRLGITPGMQVVVYDQDMGMYASRLWWMLRYLGHDAVALLDGGWGKWTREGRPVLSGEETRQPTTFPVRPPVEPVLDAAGVSRLIGDASNLLIDARSPDRFAGQQETLDRAAGHIPGAVNHFFRRNAGEDGTMLLPEQLRATFNALLAGRAPEQAVMYCGSGVTACQNLLAMAHAGLHGTRLYPGSWSEWSSDPSRPVETGPVSRT